MTELTKEQTTFLTKHNTAVGSVFDATGLGKNDYRKLMKDLGKTVAIGVTPCKKGNHAMRTRSGHCIQCNPASLAFQKRHSMNGYVYIAGSLELSVIKVGLASDVEERMKSLNRLNYAGLAIGNVFFGLRRPKLVRLNLTRMLALLNMQVRKSTNVGEEMFTV